MLNELEDRLEFKPITDGFVPTEDPFVTAIAWLGANVILDQRNDIVLEPVRADHSHSMYVLCLGLTKAWQDPQLRSGYLPQTPRTFTGAQDVVNNYWLNNSNKLVYLYGQLSTFGSSFWSGYLTLEMTGQHSEITYGVFGSDKAGQGHTTLAVDTALSGIEYAFYTFGLSIDEHRTMVSDLNTASKRVLQKNGYSLTMTEPIQQSPIAMGGSNLFAIRSPHLRFDIINEQSSLVN